MEEKQVTIGDETFRLPEPFFVLATQNPIEQEGTYNLPEAELDRFLMKLVVSYPSGEDEVKIVKTAGNAVKTAVNQVLSAGDIRNFRRLAESVVCSDKIVEYIVQIISVTRPSEKKQSEHDKYQQRCHQRLQRHHDIVSASEWSLLWL